MLGLLECGANGQDGIRVLGHRGHLVLRFLRTSLQRYDLTSCFGLKVINDPLNRLDRADTRMTNNTNYIAYMMISITILPPFHSKSHAGRMVTLRVNTTNQCLIILAMDATGTMQELRIIT